MNKNTVNEFVSRIYLGGSVSSCKIESSGKKLSTMITNEGKTLVGRVSSLLPVDKGQFAIYDISKFSQFINILDEDLNIKPVSVNGEFTSLLLKDSNIAINYTLADMAVLGDPPKIRKIPEFDIDIEMDEEFVVKYIRSFHVMSDLEKFTFVKKNGDLNLVFGQSNINTNMINIKLNCKKCPADFKPISFPSKEMKEILAVNRTFEKATFRVFSGGLLNINFEGEGYEADYYLIASN